MQRSDLKELHYITPCQNVPDILKYGILSYNRVRSGVRGGKLRSVSVSMPEVQRLREQKCMPNGRRLHDYVNLYFCARNPMLCRLRMTKNLHEKLCVLRIAPSVLDIKGAVISDRNAACASANFYPSPEGLVHLDPTKIFARVWYYPFSKRRQQITLLSNTRSCSCPMSCRRAIFLAPTSRAKRRATCCERWHPNFLLEQMHIFSFLGNSHDTGAEGRSIPIESTNPGQHGELHGRDGQGDRARVQKALPGDVQRLCTPMRSR